MRSSVQFLLQRTASLLLILTIGSVASAQEAAQAPRWELLTLNGSLHRHAPDDGAAEKCVWTPSPGKYKLHVIATDADGAVGKSDPIEITIERP